MFEPRCAGICFSSRCPAPHLEVFSSHTSSTKICANAYASLFASHNSYCVGKIMQHCQSMCVCYPRYYTIIKYLFKSVLRKASCCTALFNCTSAAFWILEARTSRPSGSWKLPSHAGMRDNWITCMCQIVLINRTGAAGMYGWCKAEPSPDWNVTGWIQNIAISHEMPLSKKTESRLAPGVLFLRDCELRLLWWDS